MSEKLGEYVTREYAILKQVFSFLSSKDLSVASKVCREWEEVSNRVILKRNKPVCYWKKHADTWDSFCTGIQPKIVLHYSTKYGLKNFGKEDFLYKLREVYDMTGVAVVSLRNNCFISSHIVDGRLEIISKQGSKKSEAIFLLCDMPGVTLKCFHLQWNADIAIADESLNDVLNPKGLLVFSGGDDSCTALTYHIINAIRTKSVDNLKMAGGITHRVLQSNPISSDSPPANNGVVGITFHGDNVDVQIGLHELSKDLHTFMEEFANKIGPLPSNCIRYAFMFTCVNRLKLLKEDETNVFNKYFPDVPIYGFWSYGEFALLDDQPSVETPPEKRRRTYPSNVAPYKECFYEECSSYFIVTFKLCK